MADPRDVARPYAPPDGSDPAARDTMRVTAPVQVGDRVAWVTMALLDPRTPRRLRRACDYMGRVIGRGAGTVRVKLDSGPVYDAPADEVYPRPGR